MPSIVLTIVFVAALLLSFAPEIKGYRYRRRGARVDNGRGPLFARTPVSGTRVTFACGAVGLQGIIFDNAEGDWALGHLPERVDAHKVSVPGHTRMEYFQGCFGDGDEVEEVRRMSRLEHVREGDITLAVVRARGLQEAQHSVAITLWGRKPHLVPDKCVLVGRLSYESFMSIGSVEDRGYVLEMSRSADVE